MMRALSTMLPYGWFACLALAASSLAAQADITPADVRRHVDVIAADSMMGRGTPSPGLAKTARYVAEQFKALGLDPAGDPVYAGRKLYGVHDQREIPWLQQYPIPGRLRMSISTTLTLTARVWRDGKDVIDERGEVAQVMTEVGFDANARFAVDTMLESGGVKQWVRVSDVQPRTPVLTGWQTPASVAAATLDGSVAIFIPPTGMDSTAQRRAINQIVQTSDVLVLPPEDSVTFATRLVKSAERLPVAIERILEESAGPHHWVAYVRPGAVGAFLQVAGLDLAALRADTVPQVRPVPSIGVFIQPVVTRPGGAADSAMNVAGVLPGTDSLMADQLVVIAAHMDGAGVEHGRADSIQNGGNDNASGVAGLLVLAKALSQPSARPKRPIAFVATSGGAAGKGLWGANAYAAPAGIDVVYVLNLSLDMIGRPAGDSLLVDGLHDLDFATPPDWMAMQHAELGLRLVDGGSIFEAEADPVAFAQHAVPSLYIHARAHGAHPDEPDTPSAVDADYEARVLRLLYYVVRDLADGPRMPTWTAAARKQRGEYVGR